LTKPLAFLSSDHVLVFASRKERIILQRAGFFSAAGQWRSPAIDASNATRIKQALLSGGFAIGEELYLFLSRMEGTIK
jgi:hypothetical protein